MQGGGGGGGDISPEVVIFENSRKMAQSVPTCLQPIVALCVLSCTSEIDKNVVCAFSSVIGKCRVCVQAMFDRLLVCVLFVASAGIGRTGTFIVIDSLVDLIKEQGEFDLSINPSFYPPIA